MRSLGLFFTKIPCKSFMTAKLSYRETRGSFPAKIGRTCSSFYHLRLLRAMDKSPTGQYEVRHLISKLNPKYFVSSDLPGISCGP